MKDPSLPRDLSLKNGTRAIMRHPAAADAAALVDFVQNVDRESDFLSRLPGEFNLTVEQEREYIDAQMEDPDSAWILVQVEDGIAATGHVRGHTLKRLTHHAELALAVRKHHWGCGIGRHLMTFMIENCRRRGLMKVWLTVFDHNERGIRLYESLGFNVEGRSRKEVRRGDGTYGDMIKMGLFL